MPWSSGGKAGAQAGTKGKGARAEQALLLGKGGAGDAGCLSEGARSHGGTQRIVTTPYGGDHEGGFFRTIVLQKGMGRGIHTER
jgi:hypothetical protein